VSAPAPTPLPTAVPPAVPPAPAPTPQAARSWPRRLLGLLLLLGLLAAGGVAGLWWQAWRGYERTDNAYVRGDIAIVSPRVEGYVEAVLVADHQAVTPGTPLVRLVNDRLLAEQAQSRAEVARRAAALENHRARLAEQRSMIAVAEAHTGTAKAEVTQAENDLERSSKLVRKGWTTQQIHDDNKAHLSIAKAQFVEAVAQAAAARRKLAVLESEGTALRADLQNAEAALRLAEIALQDAVVRAPVAGVVGNREVQPGEFVRAGTHLMALVPTDGLWVEANFKETQIGAMQPGQPAEIAVDSFAGAVLCGSVKTLAPASGAEFALLPPDNASGNFTKIVRRIPVRLHLPDDHPRRGDLRPGMSVVVTVPGEAATSARPAGSLTQRILALLGLAPDSTCFE
jgi:membrane fusion protein (multidrug efflux system)